MAAFSQKQQQQIDNCLKNTDNGVCALVRFLPDYLKAHLYEKQYGHRQVNGQPKNHLRFHVSAYRTVIPPQEKYATRILPPDCTTVFTSVKDT
jgi:hypothetical protein